MTGRPGIPRLRSRARANARNHSGTDTPNMYFTETQKDWWKRGLFQTVL